VRLYSIASSRYGDAFDGQTATLCVRRATFWDSELGKEDPAKKGICSNFLCDAKPGTTVQMTGTTPPPLLRAALLRAACLRGADAQAAPLLQQGRLAR
jgi:ferredoxin--NADP+ reductase